MHFERRKTKGKIPQCTTVELKVVNAVLDCRFQNQIISQEFQDSIKSEESEKEFWSPFILDSLAKLFCSKWEQFFAEVYDLNFYRI